METANDVHRIEVSCRSKSTTSSLIRHIDLNALKHLKRCRTVLLPNDERTTTRLTLILHHTGNADRSVKFLTKSLNSCLAVFSWRKSDAQFSSKELLNIITKALNSLTVNGGTIEGANKSIWMQDPSTNANTGTLTVSGSASLYGDVYLFVTAGSTEWPVDVSIAAAALKNGATVMTGNIPAQYVVAEVDGIYTKVTAAAKMVRILAAIIVKRRPIASKSAPVIILPSPLQTASTPTSVVASAASAPTESARSRAKLMTELPTAVKQMSARNTRQKVNRRTISEGV